VLLCFATCLVPKTVKGVHELILKILMTSCYWCTDVTISIKCKSYAKTFLILRRILRCLKSISVFPKLLKGLLITWFRPRTKNCSFLEHSISCTGNCRSAQNITCSTHSLQIIIEKRILYRLLEASFIEGLSDKPP